ncbi:hypothetical protein [Kushneria sp. TE3]|uniref:hypothetical protein n=1 Tax=Kushneria sp. TE3 TaxID=3449832 RepID=UPI003F6880F1
MKMWKRLRANLKKRYQSAQRESAYKIPYRIVGNGVLVADAKDIVKSGAFKERLAQCAELEKMLRDNR